MCLEFGETPVMKQRTTHRKAVEHRAKAVIPSFSLLPAQCQLWSHNGSLLVGPFARLTDQLSVFVYSRRK
jgi:hypothetical protein